MSKVKPANSDINLKRGIDHIGVSVVAVIHDGKGNILLMKRGPKARDENGHWDVVGGALEFGESFHEAIHRELSEEILTKPLDIKYLTTYDAHREHKGRKTHWVAVVHTVLVDPKEVKNGEPHKIDELKWFDIKKLPKPLHSQFYKSYDALHKAGFPDSFLI